MELPESTSQEVHHQNSRGERIQQVENFDPLNFCGSHGRLFTVYIVEEVSCLSHLHNTSNTVSLLHHLESTVDLVQRLPMCDELVDLQLAG